MPDDGVIYEGRKASRRTRHLRVIPKSESFEPRAVTPFESFLGTKGMLRDSREPEVAHPSGSRNHTKMYGAAIMNTDTARANAIRSAGKQAFLSVVKETVELVALEAASKAVHEETERMEELRHSEMCSNGTSSTNRPSKPNGSLTNNNIASITRWPINPHMPQTVRSSDVSHQDNTSSARHLRGRNNNSSSSSRNGHAPSSERCHRRSRSASREEEEGGSLSFRSTVDPMEDEERETLLSLLTGAYSQVNELTDELQIALQKLHETEQNLKTSSTASESQSQQSSETQDSVDATDAAPPVVAPDGNTRPMGGMFFKGFFPVDEGARSTPATVRQLQVEVQRLRQRVMQSNSKEEKYRAELARNQRLIAVMESQMGGADVQGPAPGTSTTGNKRLNGSSTAGSPDPKPLVDRVAELEEKLVNCSMENATAKQDHLASKLRASQLEKNVERFRHELAKSRAMNDLLQNEIDRLQGTMDPEDEADGKGWRRWLGGVQEPLSPEPNPVRVQGLEDSDSPVVVVRDLDNNQLVYAPGRSEFF